MIQPPLELRVIFQELAPKFNPLHTGYSYSFYQRFLISLIARV